ncbi:hypothetical protein DFH09DRAFT_578394 [Mycena vulgaris]|nr:hypothetical protein DFH09DRAFT_638749 [Mycena vulgaris]KAJ6555060.1 hypothetical protein DFH09DRAFT_578394 [Mycena vulgaris]
MPSGGMRSHVCRCELWTRLARSWVWPMQALHPSHKGMQGRPNFSCSLNSKDATIGVAEIPGTRDSHTPPPMHAGSSACHAASIVNPAPPRGATTNMGARQGEGTKHGERSEPTSRAFDKYQRTPSRDAPSPPWSSPTPPTIEERRPKEGERRVSIHRRDATVSRKKTSAYPPTLSRKSAVRYARPTAYLTLTPHTRRGPVVRALHA